MYRLQRRIVAPKRSVILLVVVPFSVLFGVKTPSLYVCRLRAEPRPHTPHQRRVLPQPLLGQCESRVIALPFCLHLCRDFETQTVGHTTLWPGLIHFLRI